MTPADELTAAADRLEALAGAATEGPWTPEGELHEFADYTGYDVDAGDGFVTRLATEADAAYIAAMSPDVGLLLATWLRAEGKRLERRGHVRAPNEALDLARAINRG